ncbi:hypothetical protein D6850_08435 [Roseovarius spongiae]|uniref:Uncharacterized protein n=1 Tax=Roseovarius spongiae TaxID=2320272 RepID=A0A3A8ATI2_9RHOB|nr:hypothetical protein [Roseovarius spongiae]RKF14889.1 hypothetical protein D6850_08435 [Roseovarius spongiae]
MLHEDTIPVPDELKELMALPACADVSFPQVGDLGISLPNGGRIQAIPDLTNGIPDDCSLATNLLIQLQPYLASIACLLKVLGLIEPLIKVVKGLNPPDPIKLAQAVPDFIEAAAALAPCLGMLIPGVPIYNFVKDLLRLIIKIIKCMIGSLQTVLGVMQGIGLRLEAAEAAGNTQLKALLECAQENASNSARHAQAALGPVENLMPMVMSFLELAGVSFELPELGDPEDAEALAETIQKLEETVTVLEQIIENLP